MLEILFQGHTPSLGWERLSKYSPILADISKTQISFQILKVLSHTSNDLVIRETWYYGAINKIRYKNSPISAQAA